ncbi:hypothetical protein SJ05684_c10420 [Sinorhizobium sojae CCBAU 05684]|uniref:Uncharacterized protein n=1 Tax=Sinorhizobium sojae CCBAU 05684 TaxID=716928 RepID=A0A249P995_9HYPH|nr:hypothetical protein [Sinorhizobium sojae]ASY62500.1 hypothetical protein SJ05684_c10420 [Sinorhizobium sojae CCBAU 05684]
MTCNFYVGQKVVLAEPYGADAIIRATINGDVLPSPEVVYTIRRIRPPFEGIVFILLNELVNHTTPGTDDEASFNAARFRPVVDRKTDISVFTDMLTEQKAKVDA